VVDAGVRKPLDLKIQVPVESMSSRAVDGHLDPLTGRGGEPPALDLARDLPAVLDLVKQHRSTIVFVNTAAWRSASRCVSTSWPTRRSPRAAFEDRPRAPRSLGARSAPSSRSC